MRDRAMMILGDLVGFPTVTTESNLALIDHAVGLLEPLGATTQVTRDETGRKANLLATIGPAVDGGVILSGHCDVVPADEPDWTEAPFVAMRREQKIFGRGTADMKGFIACALALAPRFAEAPLVRPVHIAITFDEEVGCRGAPLLLAELAKTGPKPAAAIVGEPTGMSVVTAHKGMYEYTTTVIGLEGHGSVPGRAVNAVHFGARYVAKLMELASRLEARAPAGSPYDPPHTTISVGAMRGGTARNVVAGECILEWEMRPVSRSDATYVLDEVAMFERQTEEEMRLVSQEASIVTVTEGAVDGLEDDEASYAAGLAGELVGNTRRETAAFGTEAGLYQMAGISAVVCGPGSIEVAHRPDEYIGLDQLEHCLTALEGLIPKLTSP